MLGAEYWVMRYRADQPTWLAGRPGSRFRYACPLCHWVVTKKQYRTATARLAAARRSMYQDATHAQAVLLARVVGSRVVRPPAWSHTTKQGAYSMAERVQPTDLELAALISSKICHDLIGPVGNINNGLEILDEEDDAQSRNYALDVIRNVTETASARLQFARFAFGATDSAGAKIDLGTAEELSRGLIGAGKHKLAWRGLKGQIAKDKAKLLLNLVAVSPTAIPRGGDIVVEIAGTLAAPSFIVRCHGPSARPPQYLGDFVNGPAPPINAMTIQAYYTVRLAMATRMRLAILRDGTDVVLTAKG